MFVKQCYRERRWFDTQLVNNKIFVVKVLLPLLLSWLFVKPVVAQDCQPMTINVSQNQNFILTTTPRIAGFNPSATGYSTCDVMQTIQYFDGIGRPLQTIQIKGSTNGNDVVQPVVYDTFGREALKYLPYTVSSANAGSYQSTALTDQHTFYTPTPVTGVSAISTPQAGTAFEPSPLNRVVEQGAPGDAWQLTGTSVGTGTSGHTVRRGYTTNTGASTDTGSGRPAIAYLISSINSNQSRTLINNGSFNLDLLDVTVTQDENHTTSRGGTTETYTDKEGHVILKRTFTNVGGVSQFYSTYYVYDNLGNLCYVLPPGSLPDAGLTSSVNQTVLDNLCYQYRFDERNRLTQKKLPGKGWEYMVYNQLDQLVLSQDSLQRQNNQWIVIKYDQQGRSIITALWNAGSTVSLSTLQASIYAGTQWDVVDYTNTTGTYPYGYVLTSYPTVSSVLTVNYYDGYNNIPNLPSQYISTSGVSKMTTGLMTASLTNILGTTNMLMSVHYYDDLSRNIKTYVQHYYNAAVSTYNYDLVTTTYNFSNQTTTVTRQHYNTTNGATPPVVTTVNQYLYDHIGRRTKNWETITVGTSSPGTRTLLSQVQYNEIGQVIYKSLHSTDSINFFQNIAYTFNERGWLLTNNAVNNTSNLFSEQLQYNTGTNKQYNGNITYQNWQSTTTPATNTYAYNYDQLNRVTSANSSLDNNNENSITYDLMGNIKTLNRTAGGASTYIDQLNYTYAVGGNNTNQLQTLNDGSSSDQGLLHGNWTYLYDGNGNLTNSNYSTATGQNKSTTYNLLNLPLVATTAAGTSTFTYDATGNKLRKVYVLGSNTTTTEYIAGIQYSGGTISFIQTEEGAAVWNGTNYNYNYFLTDHLGNTRLSFDIYNSAVRKDQQDDYYAFGMAIQRGAKASPTNDYLFNKKELQEELGQYDFGARFYDPVIGSWNVIDPLAEKMRRYSPYIYGFDDPIRFTDPDGMGPEDWVKKDNTYFWDDRVVNQKTATKYQGKGAEYIGKSRSIFSVGISYRTQRETDLTE